MSINQSQIYRSDLVRLWHEATSRDVRIRAAVRGIADVKRTMSEPPICE
jgi:hypothetical protein